MWLAHHLRSGAFDRDPRNEMLRMFAGGRTSTAGAPSISDHPKSVAEALLTSPWRPVPGSPPVDRPGVSLAGRQTWPTPRLPAPARPRRFGLGGRLSWPGPSPCPGGGRFVGSAFRIPGGPSRSGEVRPFGGASRLVLDASGRSLAGRLQPPPPLCRARGTRLCSRCDLHLQLDEHSAWLLELP